LCFRADTQIPEREEVTVRAGHIVWIAAALLLVMLACIVTLVVAVPAGITNWRDSLAPVEPAAPERQAETQPETEAPRVEEPKDEETEAEPRGVTVSMECPTTAEAKELTGVDVQRLGTEPCAWVWRAVPEASTPATCPDGWVCTWDLGGQVAVYDGYAKSGVVAGTWRMVKPYPEGDAVHDPCALLRKEQAFGAEEVPSFEVAAGNFECTD
jgi:hypothetical protein